MGIIKKLAIAVSIVLVSTKAYADNSYVTTGKLVRIDPLYTNVTSNQPYQHCGIKEVPVYGSTGGDAGANALGGMIIGGLLGKAIGGNDKGAAAGAILGGVIGADK